MSWKPCRGSGIMIDRYQRKEREYCRLTNEMITNNNPLRFEHIKTLSKYVYLAVLNGRKAMSAIGGSGKVTLTESSFIAYYCPPRVMDIFKRNKELLYKPMQQIIN